MHKSRRSPPRRQPSTRSINRDFRCPSRWLTPFSIPLVVIVVAWATLLFFGFGLPSGGNVMSYVVLAVGALAVTSAAYLILDLSGRLLDCFAFRPRRST